MSQTRLVVLAALLPATASFGNLLGDPGFEAGPVECPPETPWEAFGEAYVDLDGDQQSGGTKALKLFQNFTGDDNFSGAVQFVTVTAGSTYKLSGLIRNGADPTQMEPDVLTGGNYGLPKIEWIDEFDEVTAAHEDTVRAVVRPSSVANEWMEFELIAQAPSDALQAKVVLVHVYLGNGEDTGSTWFDDIDFDVTTDPQPADKPDNLLIDGGFDDDPETNWFGFGNTFFETSFFASPLLAFNGTAAKMFQTFSGPGTNVSGLVQTVPVTEGVSYLYTGRARNGAPTDDFMGVDNRALLKIEWLDSEGMRIEDTAVEDPTTGEIDEFSETGIWHELAIAGVAPEGAVEADVLILHVAEGNGPDNGGASFFDDLCFREGFIPVPPSVELVDVSYSPGSCTVEWTSDPNCLYELQKSTDLENWSPVASEVPDNGGTASATDDEATDPATYYRVIKFGN